MNFANVQKIMIPEGEIVKIESDGVLLWEKKKYKARLEYLETTGTQYLKTGITATGHTRVVAKMILLQKNSSGNYAYLFGSKSPYFSVRAHWSNGYPYNTYGSTQSIIFYENTVGEIWNINFGCGKATVNDYSKNIEYVEFEDGELVMFARGSGSNKGTGRVYEFKAYDGENLVRDFIPVLDLDNVPCLYDNVSGELFYNSGTGEFLYA